MNKKGRREKNLKNVEPKCKLFFNHNSNPKAYDFNR